MKLILGIGNKGDRFKFTRHNLGFLIVNFIAHKRCLNWSVKNKLKSFLAYSEHFILCRTHEYMNLSGIPVALIKNYFKIPLKNILVIHDDLDLNFLKIKLKLGGGNGGHNGLNSIDTNLSQKGYFRLRFGIGRPNHFVSVEDYVLGRFTSSQLALVNEKIEFIESHIIDLFVNDEIEKLKSILATNNSAIDSSIT